MIYTTTYSKTITANNQTWNADDSTNILITQGAVNVKPTIRIVADKTEASVGQINIDGHYSLNNASADAQIASPTSTGATTAFVNDTTQRGQLVDCRKLGMQIIDSFRVSVIVYTGGNITCKVYDTISKSTLLATKVVNMTTTGLYTFTFDTPILIPWYNQTCTNTTSSRIYFDFTGSGVNISCPILVGNQFPDGAATENGIASASLDLIFTVYGHSGKNIKQTFKVITKGVLGKIKLNVCKYTYTGSNSIEIAIMDGLTEIGSGTLTTLPSSFEDVYVYMNQITPGSLLLVPDTVYTLIVTPPSDSSHSTSILIKMKQSNIYSNGELTLTDNTAYIFTPGHDLYFTCYTSNNIENISVYNTADDSVVCTLSNLMFAGSIYIVNADATGSIIYSDVFTDAMYIYATNTWTLVTYDNINNKLNIADNGYIYYAVDCKYPIEGIPTLTAQIDITAGIPTIQISTDAATWYDIDTAIVDDVNTEYELDNAINLQLDGLTSFYFRFDCGGTGIVTCSVKAFELNINIDTTTAQNPYIFYDTINTFKCDQGAESGINCTIELISEESILQPIIIF